MFKILMLTAALVLAKAPEKTVVKVNGMVCSFCAQGIKKTFHKMEPIADVQVDLDHKLVTLRTKDGQTLPDAEIQRAINDAGYDVLKIERKE